MYHEVRFANGSWTGLQPIAGYGTSSPAGGKDVSIAGMFNGDAQVMIVGVDDMVYHEVRLANGSWTGLQPIAGYGTSSPASGSRVTITGMPNGAAQIAIVGRR